MKQERLNLYRIDMKYDSISERNYKQLCIDELNWCRKNRETITNKANCLYRFCEEDSNYKGKSRCLDFKKLEKECEEYNMGT